MSCWGVANILDLDKFYHKQYMKNKFCTNCKCTIETYTSLEETLESIDGSTENDRYDKERWMKGSGTFFLDI